MAGWPGCSHYRSPAGRRARAARQEALSDLTNALQAAAPLATQQRRVLGALAQNALTIEARLKEAHREITPDKTIDDFAELLELIPTKHEAVDQTL